MENGFREHLKDFRTFIHFFRSGPPLERIYLGMKLENELMILLQAARNGVDIFTGGITSKPSKSGGPSIPKPPKHPASVRASGGLARFFQLVLLLAAWLSRSARKSWWKLRSIPGRIDDFVYPERECVKPIDAWLAEFKIQALRPDFRVACFGELLVKNSSGAWVYRLPYRQRQKAICAELATVPLAIVDLEAVAWLELVSIGGKADLREFVRKGVIGNRFTGLHQYVETARYFVRLEENAGRRDACQAKHAASKTGKTGKAGQEPAANSKPDQTTIAGSAEPTGELNSKDATEEEPPASDFKMTDSELGNMLGHGCLLRLPDEPPPTDEKAKKPTDESDQASGGPS